MAEPLELTVPFSVAPLPVMDAAASVVAVGGIALVVNVWSLPLAAPWLLVPLTRKW